LTRSSAAVLPQLWRQEEIGVLRLINQSRPWWPRTGMVLQHLGDVVLDCHHHHATFGDLGNAAPAALALL